MSIPVQVSEKGETVLTSHVREVLPTYLTSTIIFIDNRSTQKLMEDHFKQFNELQGVPKAVIQTEFRLVNRGHALSIDLGV